MVRTFTLVPDQSRRVSSTHWVHHACNTFSKLVSPLLIARSIPTTSTLADSATTDPIAAPTPQQQLSSTAECVGSTRKFAIREALLLLQHLQIEHQRCT